MKNQGKLVKEAGHKPYLIPESCNAVSAIARGNTVMIWQKNDKCVSASPGDPTELK